ncbi:MAG: GtrA family protein [Thermomicrobiaceae bacterium]|nr:GtrA family protein [Thermomicrobiaceae bacterium]
MARFAAVGLACGALQLGLLAGLVRLGAPHVLANLAALVLSTQVNFLLSAALIWPERSTLSQPPSVVLARLVGFNATAAATTLLNEAVFAAAFRVVPYLVAGAAGIAVAAPINYLVQHGLIFQRHEGKPAHEPRRLDLRRPAGL